MRRTYFRRIAGLAVALVLAAAASAPPARAEEPPQKPLQKPDRFKASAVGDVVYSVLAPELFARTHEGRWVLLDGGLLPTDSALYAFLQQSGRLDIFGAATQAPRVFDARGQFLRGLNLTRDPKEGDPAGPSRKVGSSQPDQIGKHTHAGDRYSQHKRAGKADLDRFNAANESSLSKETGPAGGNPRDESDVETRPRNIALYVYIKVD